MRRKRVLRILLFFIGVTLFGYLIFEFRYLLTEQFIPSYKNYRVSRIPSGYDVHGIDVSHYQGRINWDKLGKINKKIPVDFVIVRATMGALGADREFRRNWKACRRKNLLRGAYHYYNPNVNSLLQAENFILTVHLEEGDLPPVLDIEKISRLQDMDNLRKGVRKWLEKVHQHYGVKPILYTGASFYEEHLDGYFDDYPLWIANYNRVQRPINEDWIIWQYTETGTIDGVRGYVDMNVYRGSMSDLLQMSY